LALVIVDFAFFIMHIYHNYEPLMLLSFSFVPFWPSIALFYEPSEILCKHINLKVVDGVAV